MTDPTPENNRLEERLAYEKARHAELRGQLKRQQRLRKQTVTLLAVAVLFFIITLLGFFLLNAFNG